MTTAPVVAGFPRVNLMPRSEIARRERDKLARMWVWIILVAVVIAGLIIVAAFGFKLLADQRLVAEQAKTNALLTEIASLSEVSSALAAEAELTQFRSEAMATDLEWTPVLDTITGILPPDTTLTGFNVEVGGVPQGEDPTVEAGLVGTITVDSPTPLDLPDIIRSLRGGDGVLYADGQSISQSFSSEERYAYQLSIEFDQTVYSDAFTTEEGGE